VFGHTNTLTYVRDEIAAVGNVRLINEGDDDIVSKRNIDEE
jgi:hypothetical protein